MAWSRLLKLNGVPFLIEITLMGQEGETCGFYLRDPETITAIRSRDPRILDALSAALSEIDGISAVMNLHDGMYYDYWIDNPEKGRGAAHLILQSKYADENDRRCARAILAAIEKNQRREVEKQAKKVYSKKRRSQFQNERAQLMLALIDRDGYQCNKCGNQEDLTIDHIVPLSKGGSDNLGNLQLLCRSHNSKKGDANG